MGIKDNMWLKLLLVLILLGFKPNGVLAQTYVFESGDNNKPTQAHVVANAEYTQYIYGQLSVGHDNVDYYTLDFTHSSPQTQIDLMVLKTSQFRPSIIVTDPYSRRMFGQIPFNFPSSMGGRVYNWEKNKQQAQTDPDAFGDHMSGPIIIKDYTLGKYLVAVFDPNGQGGKYLIRVSGLTKSGNWLDLLYKLMAYLRVKLLIY